MLWDGTYGFSSLSEQTGALPIELTRRRHHMFVPYENHASLIRWKYTMIFLARGKKATEWNKFWSRNDLGDFVTDSCLARPFTASYPGQFALSELPEEVGGECEFSRQAWQVTSHLKSPRTTGNEAGPFTHSHSANQPGEERLAGSGLQLGHQGWVWWGRDAYQLHPRVLTIWQKKVSKA